MPTQLTEVQAWEEVARRFAGGEVHEGEGLCNVVSRLWYLQAIVRDTDWIMCGRIGDYLDIGDVWAYQSVSEYGIRYCVKNDEGRALAALWLMCEAAEEQGVVL